jgi:hypothetical protein
MFRLGCMFAYHNSPLMPFNLVSKNPSISGGCDSEVYSKPQRTNQDKTHPDILIRDNTTSNHNTKSTIWFVPLIYFSRLSTTTFPGFRENPEARDTKAEGFTSNHKTCICTYNINDDPISKL